MDFFEMKPYKKRTRKIQLKSNKMQKFVDSNHLGYIYFFIYLFTIAY
jgi:hypothetical protein